MGKYDSGYPKVDRDHYPTPPWCVAALAEHVDLAGKRPWECACGDGRMSEALKANSAKFVLSTDIVDLGHRGFSEVFDFLSGDRPKTATDGVVTNPPFGPRGKTAEAFIISGLRHIVDHGGFLALLLPADFDSAKARAHLFRDCRHFAGKIVLTRRIIWFARTDGKREAPRENSAWFLWERTNVRAHQAPSIRYAPNSNPQGGRRG